MPAHYSMTCRRGLNRLLQLNPISGGIGPGACSSFGWNVLPFGPERAFRMSARVDFAVLAGSGRSTRKRTSPREGWNGAAARERAPVIVASASVEDRHEEGALVSREAPGFVEPRRGRLARFIVGDSLTISVVGLDARETEQGERDIRRRSRT